jgi:anti-sigma factor NepR-like protein
VATSLQRRGWGLVKKDQKPDRERSRAIKARQRAIGRELRRVYDDVAQEPVPNEFLDLLQKMDKPDSAGSGGVP